jgi:hypothetical protein
MRRARKCHDEDIIDLVPIDVRGNGVPVYETEFDAAALAACQLIMQHPNETKIVLALAGVAIVCWWAWRD